MTSEGFKERLTAKLKVIEQERVAQDIERQNNALRAEGSFWVVWREVRQSSQRVFRRRLIISMLVLAHILVLGFLLDLQLHPYGVISILDLIILSGLVVWLTAVLLRFPWR